MRRSIVKYFLCALFAAALTLCTQPALAAPASVSTYAELANAMATETEIALTANIAVEAPLLVTSRVHISGDYALTRAAGFKGALLTVTSGGSLTIRDVVLDGGRDAGVTDALISVSNGTLYLLGGATLKDNYNHGGLYAANYAIVTIDEHALITGNKNLVRGGGGVSALGGSTLTIQGDARITNNVSEANAKLDCAGGVYTAGCEVYVREHAEISGNSSMLEAGGITANGSVMTLSGSARILNNRLVASNAGVTAGAGVNIDNGAQCSITGNVRIAGNVSTAHGGGIDLEASTLEISGNVVIENNTAAQGGGIYADGGTTCAIGGYASVSGNTATDSGGGMYTNFVAGATVGGHASISGNTATNSGGGVCVNAGTNIVIEEYAVIGENEAGMGGGISIVNVGTVAIRGAASIIKNSSPSNGGGIYAYVGDNLEIMDVEISGNSATSGGGLYLKDIAATVSGHASIRDNTGGGVYWEADIRKLLQFKDTASVTGNTDYGVSAPVSGYYAFQDAVRICDNHRTDGSGTYDADVYNFQSLPLLSAPLREGANIGVYNSSTYYLVNNMNWSNYLKTMDESAYYHPTDNDSIYIRDLYTHKKAILRDNVHSIVRDTTIDAHPVSVLIPDSANPGLLVNPENDGFYWYASLSEAFDDYVNTNNRGEARFTLYVNRPASESETLSVPSDATAVISGAKITQVASDRSLFEVKDGGTLILKGVTVQGYAGQTSAPLIMVRPGGTLILDAGATIAGCDSASDGAAVWNDGAMQILPGAVVKGCHSSKNGGAIYSDNTWAYFEMKGGAITGCRAANGGAIYAVVYASSAFQINGGAITSNFAESHGGGLYVKNNEINIRDSVISGNGATHSGGGIYAVNAPLDMLNGVIQDNTAENGGGVYITGDNGALAESSVHAGAIKNNTAGNNGGGVYDEWKTLHLHDDVSIVGNSATRDGGGVYLGNHANASLNAENAAIVRNSAQNGGGVHAAQGAVTLTGATVTDNTATTGSGGGVYKADAATLAIGGATQLTGNGNSNLFMLPGGSFTVSGNLYSANIGLTTAPLTYPAVIGIPQSGVAVGATDAAAVKLDSDANHRVYAEGNRLLLGNALIKLGTPAGLAWSDAAPGTATWNALGIACRYAVHLYKNNTRIRAAETASGVASYDFSSVIAAEGAGGYTFRVTALADGAGYTDGIQSAASPEYRLTAPTIVTDALPEGTVGVMYSQTLEATGDAPIAWRVSSGVLPDWLSLDADTGVLSGMPTATGTRSFTVTATNGVSPNATKTLSIIINAAPAQLVVTASPQDQFAVVGQRATFTVSATGDRLSYQWFIDRGNGSGWRALQGATGESYVTSVVELANDGFRYFCRVTDARGDTVDSGVAVLHVQAAPESPKTGDSATPGLWLCMLLLGGAGLALMTLKKRKA